MRREEDDYDVIRFDVGRNGRNEKKVQSSPVETAQQTANRNENWQKKNEILLLILCKIKKEQSLREVEWKKSEIFQPFIKIQ